MATRRTPQAQAPKPAPQTPAPETPAPEKAPAADGDPEVQAKVDAAEEQGFFGVSPDPYPNSAYSLESGPDSPGVLEAHQAVHAAQHDK